ncbi:hypothetical protein P175DRAFT_0513956 [Aspergillus ochraceoroseus IBT 24754]|uniref:37S ribosomal protein Rsm22 n=1 Tax=Aspergillus ochraceoroseus IBT 24754 TaxID=1392256 RepID=A0A2T5M9I0_9EURO|nr:uncharacterized protein P175DRAFT_0513956 [Aspergillus ochraceoroseus IBT 24754]PTU25165.1 hypothetical protein P175DRAFT_0513956 [Aspergillus ochraceoroseus IBT 24754]
MATWAYPPLPVERLEQEADAALANELEWLLRSLQDSLASLREGLLECAALLAPKEPGSTLVLSSLRSENVKGFVTRVGTKIVKGDIQLRLSSLSAARSTATTRLCLLSSADAPELILSQLVSVRDLVNQCLDIVDVSTWTGDPLDAGFIFSQLHLLRETIAEGRQMLKGETDGIRGRWWETSAPENMFDPPLPPCLSFHLSIADSALVLYLRTLESTTPTHTPTAFASDISLTGFSIRDRLFGPRQRPHDEVGDVFQWKGGEVKVKEKRHSSTAAGDETNGEEPSDPIYDLIDKINANELEIAERLEELGLLDDYAGALSLDGPDLMHEFSHATGSQDKLTLETRVRAARQQFGETLPEGYLNEKELLLYTRLYGEPIVNQGDANHIEAQERQQDQDPDQLLREDGRGGWEVVPHEQSESQHDEVPVVYDMEVGPLEEETVAMQRTREVAEQLGFEDEGSGDSTPRLHPLTVEGKFGPGTTTVFPPKDTLTGPISIILSDYSNKHVMETAHRAFGGKLLPHSTTTPPARAQVPQLPIPMEASQRYMTDMEANAYLAVLYPGMYASALSVLSEIRKRLGSDWIRSLISQKEGPNVLDASAGGAGILAWRDVLRAEYELMVPDHPKTAPYPLGRATVVTGSESLRLRASLMLENTTFLPRLPDYLHIRDKPTLSDDRAPPKRKQYDVIIAPHTLLGIEEEYLRKEYVENLWALLNPNGGVLILMEKGHQKGFEAIAGAREMLLKRYISSPGSTEYENLTQSPDESTHVQKEPGMIIAPCTNHEKCPMYQMDGHSKGRKDFCHFEQRYIRPPFLQRIIGAKDRNHEDVKFSYLAVQRGIDLRQTEGITQGVQATDVAFEGYEHLNEMAEESEAIESGTQSPPGDEQTFHTLSLPRVVYPPMKRRGHVIMDLCTPSGQIERWTVPRSYSRQAYKDARKSGWGDLWALGAKSRIPRTLKLGDKHGEGKKERLARRAAQKAELDEEDGEIGDGSSGRDLSNPLLDLSLPPRKKGQNIPSWKKHADKKKVRQASKKYSASKMQEDIE